MLPTWRVILPSLAFLGIVGWAVWAVSDWQPKEVKKERHGYKCLSGTVAEGLVYSAGREKHPRITCSACRVGKKKLGLVSLGAFNTIEFDDLVINIPEREQQIGSNSKRNQSAAKERSSSAASVVDTLNLRPVMAMANVGAKRFAGIRISKLQINRMSGNVLIPVLRADLLKNAGRRMVLHNAILFRGSEKTVLDEVELQTRPRFKLVWGTGSWDLSEIVSPTFDKVEECDLR